ncbi:hypothetical protein O3W51_48370, partial [Streptomyces sp. H39-C1]|nr:hypothetical protein [Streptomyces sp. H39-C1]
TSPSYYWYALLVIALVALDGRWEWLAVPLAGTVLYIGNAMALPSETLQPWSYGIAAGVVLAGTLLRAYRNGSQPEHTAPNYATTLSLL